MTVEFDDPRSKALLALDGTHANCVLKEFDNPHFPGTFGHGYSQRVMSENEYRLVGDFCREALLPDLIRDEEKNRLKIAYALCFVDSRVLSSEVRSALGLSPKSKRKGIKRNLPELFHFQRPTVWAVQCRDAEKYLARAHLDLEKGRSNDWVFPLELLGCLVGKNYEMINGLCFETTEFDNGAVFVEGVWYYLRGPESLIADIKVLPKTRSNVEPSALVGGKYEVEFDKGLFILSDCGGVWQPTRLFRDENIDHTEPAMELL